MIMENINISTKTNFSISATSPNKGIIQPPICCHLWNKNASANSYIRRCCQLPNQLHYIFFCLRITFFLQILTFSTISMFQSS